MSRRKKPRGIRPIEFTDPQGRPIRKLFSKTYVWVEQNNGKLKLEPTGNPWIFKEWDCCGYREIV
jgi:hypothetical protein